MEKVAVVTAYYPMRSKHPPQTYLEWIFTFWYSVSAPVIFFIEPQLAGLFKRLHDLRLSQGRETILVPFPFASLDVWSTPLQGVWKAAAALDPEQEIHSPELYAVWCAKQEFVARAMQISALASCDKFVWADAGICRWREWIPLFADSFPRADRVPRGRMLVLQIDPFCAEDRVPGADGICGEFLRRNSVGGGILASDRSGWKAWRHAYETTLLAYYKAGRFVGKDQSIMASMILAQPTLAYIIEAPQEFGLAGVPPSMARWFYLLFYLAGKV